MSLSSSFPEREGSNFLPLLHLISLPENTFFTEPFGNNLLNFLSKNINWTLCPWTIPDETDTKMNMTRLCPWVYSPVLMKQQPAFFDSSTFPLILKLPVLDLYHFTLGTVLGQPGKCSLQGRINYWEGMWVLRSDTCFWILAPPLTYWMNLASDSLSVKWENNTNQFFELLWWIGCLAWMKLSKHVTHFYFNFGC